MPENVLHIVARQSGRDASNMVSKILTSSLLFATGRLSPWLHTAMPWGLTTRRGAGASAAPSSRCSKPKSSSWVPLAMQPAEVEFARVESTLLAQGPLRPYLRPYLQQVAGSLFADKIKPLGWLAESLWAKGLNSQGTALFAPRNPPPRFLPAPHNPPPRFSLAPPNPTSFPRSILRFIRSPWLTFSTTRSPVSASHELLGFATTILGF